MKRGFRRDVIPDVKRCYSRSGLTAIQRIRRLVMRVDGCP